MIGSTLTWCNLLLVGLFGSNRWNADGDRLEQVLFRCSYGCYSLYLHRWVASGHFRLLAWKRGVADCWTVSAVGTDGSHQSSVQGGISTGIRLFRFGFRNRSLARSSRPGRKRSHLHGRIPTGNGHFGFRFGRISCASESGARRRSTCCHRRLPTGIEHFWFNNGSGCVG